MEIPNAIALNSIVFNVARLVGPALGGLLMLATGGAVWRWLTVLGIIGTALAALFLAGSVMSAVHQAEVVAHRVGEPFGTLVLAVAVTVIEVGLIVTLMASGEGSPSIRTTSRLTTIFVRLIPNWAKLIGPSKQAGGPSRSRHVMPTVIIVWALHW